MNSKEKKLLKRIYKKNSRVFPKSTFAGIIAMDYGSFQNKLGLFEPLEITNLKYEKEINALEKSDFIYIQQTQEFIDSEWNKGKLEGSIRRFAFITQTGMDVINDIKSRSMLRKIGLFLVEKIIGCLINMIAIILMFSIFKDLILSYFRR